MQGGMKEVVQLLLFPTSRFYLFISHGQTFGYSRYETCLPSFFARVEALCVQVLHKSP